MGHERKSSHNPLRNSNLKDNDVQENDEQESLNKTAQEENLLLSPLTCLNEDLASVEGATTLKKNS